jgi:hypothetical protein
MVIHRLVSHRKVSELCATKVPAQTPGPSLGVFSLNRCRKSIWGLVFYVWGKFIPNDKYLNKAGRSVHPSTPCHWPVHAIGISSPWAPGLQICILINRLIYFIKRNIWVWFMFFTRSQTRTPVSIVPVEFNIARTIIFYFQSQITVEFCWY